MSLGKGAACPRPQVTWGPNPAVDPLLVAQLEGVLWPLLLWNLMFLLYWL